MIAKFALVVAGFPLFSLLAFGQTSVSTPGAPPEIDKALRERVTQFFQYHVDGQYRKAYEMVAEDTKDEYFGAGKAKLKSFELNDIKYSDDFTKAMVNATVKRTWQIMADEHDVIVPMMTNWRLEEGKWVWYFDTKGHWLTPMGPSNIEAPQKNADGTISIPKDFSMEAVLAAARAITQKSTLDKDTVEFQKGKAGAAIVTFKNGVAGSVNILLATPPPMASLKASLSGHELNQGGTAELLLEYTPGEGDAQLPEQTIVRLATEPFNQVFEVKVLFK